MPPAILPLTEKLYVYGPLGIICGILLIAVAYLYKASVADREKHDAIVAAERAKYDATIAAERTKHQEEMKLFQERYVSKAESWMKQYYELQEAKDDIDRAHTDAFEAATKQMQALIDSLTRGKRVGGG